MFGWSRLVLVFIILLYKWWKASRLRQTMINGNEMNDLAFPVSHSLPAMGNLAWSQFPGESLTYLFHLPSLVTPSLPAPHLVPHSTSWPHGGCYKFLLAQKKLGWNRVFINRCLCGNPFMLRYARCTPPSGAHLITRPLPPSLSRVGHGARIWGGPCMITPWSDQRMKVSWGRENTRRLPMLGRWRWSLRKLCIEFAQVSDTMSKPARRREK